MNFSAEIFERANIQKMREFLLSGMDDTPLTSKSYEERIGKSVKEIHSFLEERFQDNDEREKIMNHIYAYQDETEKVFMEIGLQCGFILSAQMIANLTEKGE